MPRTTYADQYIEVRTVVINATAVGDNTVLAAIPGRRWNIICMFFHTDGTGDTLTIKSGAATARSGPMILTAATPYSFPAQTDYHPWMQAADQNQALIFNLAAGNDIAGWALIGMSG